MEKFDDAVINAELDLSREFLSDARLLFEKNSFRSASSRMYYSVFHATRSLLFKYGFKPKTHKGTFAIFGKEIIGKDLIGKEHAKILSRAYSLREQADYQPLIKIEKSELKGLLDQAEKFLKDVEGSLTHRT
jgi:uncharacterized protein (UPF0332 family)